MPRISIVGVGQGSQRKQPKQVRVDPGLRDCVALLSLTKPWELGG